jgi:hypothetical protein
MKESVDGVPGEELIARLRSRREFLKIMSAAGLAATIGPNFLTREASALEPTGPTDRSFKFSIASQDRPFDVISDEFVEHSDDFDTNTIKNYTVLSPAPERQSGRVSAGSGALSVQSNGNAKFFALFRTGEITDAPYAAVIVDVDKRR